MTTRTINLRSDHYKSTIEGTGYQQSVSPQGLVVTVESPCFGISSKVKWDIETALEHGAYPAAHAVMIQSINKANAKSTPLSCTLEYGF